MGRKGTSRRARASKIADDLRTMATQIRAGENDEQEVDVSGIEELKEELENWKDSMPENLQGGEKYLNLEEAVEALESIVDELQSLDFDEKNEVADSLDSQADALEEIEFPGMFG